MPKTGQGDSEHTNFDRRKLMTLNNRRSVVVLPIFTPNTLLERACFELNENILVLKMKQGMAKWQGFKVGQSVGTAAPVRERMSTLVDDEHLSFRRFMADIQN